MATSLVVTVIGEDKPGLVEALSSTVTAHDGSWLESRMSHMAGKFAGIVRVEVPEAAVDRLLAAFADLQSEGLRVVAEPGAADPTPAGRLQQVSRLHKAAHLRHGARHLPDARIPAKMVRH